MYAHVKAVKPMFWKQCAKLTYIYNFRNNERIELILLNQMPSIYWLRRGYGIFYLFTTQIAAYQQYPEILYFFLT